MGVTLSPKASLDLAAISTTRCRCGVPNKRGATWLASFPDSIYWLIPHTWTAAGRQTRSHPNLNIGEHIAYYQIRSSGVYVIRVLHPKQQVVLTPEE